VPACNQAKWDKGLAEVVPFHFYLLVQQNGPVFCYYMTQSACGYSKQCAEILFSSDKNSSSSVSSRAFAWTLTLCRKVMNPELHGQMARDKAGAQVWHGWVHVCQTTITMGSSDRLTCYSLDK
ncbi:hypothetical protein FQV08_0002252, partial [Pygoscelis antarcticus]